MIVRCNDAGTAIQIMSQSHRDTLDLADILHRLGHGTYEFQFVFPEKTSDPPRIELIKKALAMGNSEAKAALAAEKGGES